MNDPYQILGLAKAATTAEIKSAYRTLAKKYHPDTNQGDVKIAEKFKEISAAYSLVGDKEKRGQFDRGEIDAEGNPAGFPGGGFSGGGANPFGGRGGNPFGGGGNPFGEGSEDILNSMFGGGFGGGQRAQPRGTGRGGVTRGKDRIYEVTIEFLDAIQGAKKNITLGSGKTLSVKIPQGVKEGQQIRLKGQGDAGRFGGKSGDALIEIHITPHAFFTLNNNDIHIDVPITLKEAVLGAKVTVPTLTGQVSLTIPPNTSSGKTLRLKGKGANDVKDGPTGHQYVKFMIMLPEDHNDQLEKLISSMGDEWDHEYAQKIRQDLENK